MRVNDIVAIDHRCGRPFEQSYNESKPWFFLGEIYSSRQRNSLSYFTVNRDIFLAFFGFKSHLEAVSGDILSPNLPAIWSNTTSTFSAPTNLPPASQPPIQSPQIFLPQSPQPPQFQSSQPPPPFQQLQPQETPPPPPPPAEVPPPSRQLQPQGPPPPQASPPPLPPPPPSQQSQPQEPPPQAPQSSSRPQPPPQQSDLFDIYNKTCKEGNLFLVLIGPGAAKGELVSLDNDTQRLLPNSITSRATNHKFMVYFQDQGLRYITVKNIYHYVKHGNCDGVVYMTGCTSNFARGAFRGDSTKTRLDQISQMSFTLDEPPRDPKKRKNDAVQDDGRQSKIWKERTEEDFLKTTRLGLTRDDQNSFHEADEIIT